MADTGQSYCPIRANANDYHSHYQCHPDANANHSHSQFISMPEG